MIDETIIEYAKKIAILRGYTMLVNGLQPVKDYIDSAGQQHLGLESKYYREWEELRSTFVQTQQGEKTTWHLIAKAATIYYYCQQIEQQSGVDLWPTAFHSIQLYGVRDEEEVKIAASIIFFRRSEGEKKDKEDEIDDIKQPIFEHRATRGQTHGAPVGNTYSKKQTPGYQVSLYLSGSIVQTIQSAINNPTASKSVVDATAREWLSKAIQSQSPEVLEDTLERSSMAQGHYMGFHLNEGLLMALKHKHRQNIEDEKATGQYVRSLLRDVVSRAK